jgi:hypothetical protein
LRVVTVIALVAVLLAHGLPLAAGIALELYTQQVTTHYQTQCSIQTTACERTVTGAHSQQVVQWSICALTLLEVDI